MSRGAAVVTEAPSGTATVRFDGDAEQAAPVDEGRTPLTADDVGDCIAWAATRPSHVDTDQIVVRPRDQAGARHVHRRT